jgi:hypothetical protein
MRHATPATAATAGRPLLVTLRHRLGVHAAPARHADPGRHLDPHGSGLTDNEGCTTRRIFTGQVVLCNGTPAATFTRTVTIGR